MNPVDAPVQRATAASEELAYVRVGGDDVFAVLTRPTVEARRTAVFILSGGGRRGQGGTPSFGRNRLAVTLARALAGEGYHAVRLDYPGVGESAGGRAHIDLQEPFVPQVVGVARWVLASGEVDRLVFSGGCFGGRAGLAAAAELPEAAGAVLWASPVVDPEWGAGRLGTMDTRTYARKALGRRALAGWRDPRRRRLYVGLIKTRVARLARRLRGKGEDRVTQRGATSPLVARQLRALVERRSPVLFVYGEDDEFRADFDEARAGRLGDVLERSGGLVTVEVVDGKVHGLTTLSAQQHADASLRRFLAQLG